MQTTTSFILLISALLVSFALAHALFGMAWYSEGAFGPAWRKYTGKTGAMHTSKKQMILAHVASSVLSAFHAGGLVFAGFFIASFVMPVSWSATAALYGAVVSLWFFVTFLPSVVENIYRQHSWKAFAIDKGFGLVFALAISALAIVIPTLFQ